MVQIVTIKPAKLGTYAAGCVSEPHFVHLNVTKPTRTWCEIEKKKRPKTGSRELPRIGFSYAPSKGSGLYALFSSRFPGGPALSGLPNANAKSQRFSYAISQIATLPPGVALNRTSKSQIAARYAAFWHAIPHSFL